MGYQWGTTGLGIVKIFGGRWYHNTHSPYYCSLYQKFYNINSIKSKNLYSYPCYKNDGLKDRSGLNSPTLTNRDV